AQAWGLGAPGRNRLRSRRSKRHIACSDFFSKSRSALTLLLLLSKPHPLALALGCGLGSARTWGVGAPGLPNLERLFYIYHTTFSVGCQPVSQKFSTENFAG
ncbi:MAG: hypothetical protein HFF39_08785, partial [Lawsonibacter sp.]|nr:hypothetical protein [Lawsonibacter sp.]